MTEADRDVVFQRALKAVKDFLQAMDDFKLVEDRPVGDFLAGATAGRFIEAKEHMDRMIVELEAFEDKFGHQS